MDLSGKGIVRTDIIEESRLAKLIGPYHQAS